MYTELRVEADKNPAVVGPGRGWMGKGKRKTEGNGNERKIPLINTYIEYSFCLLDTFFVDHQIDNSLRNTLKSFTL